MKIGVVYPQTEFGNDPIAIRDYAQTAEGLGYHHILAYDHILGANPERPEGWPASNPYNYQHSFQEPLMLFSYLTGLTQKIHFASGVIILPQRQTAVFAKQAATLDVLSGGRTRLGLGLGWNEIEYMSLNQDFHTRGKRIEEQIDLLRLLWTQPLVTFHGRWDSIPDAGINPLPIQQPIPIWLGGYVEAVLKRAARLADGWMAGFRHPTEAPAVLSRLERYLEEAGRQKDTFGIEIRISYGDGTPKSWQAILKGWQDLGISHISLNTMNIVLHSSAGHIQAITKFARALSDNSGKLPKDFYL